MTTANATARTAPCDHAVHVYRRPQELADAVASHLAAGFAAGESAAVVATATHWPSFAATLASRGWAADELEASGLLHRVDAHETLESILEAGTPSPTRFADVVGGLIDRAAAHSATGRVRAFGEMVDVLVRRRQARAADELEELWNRLAKSRSFSLLCGYKIDVFDADAHVALLPRVYRAHSQVLSRDEARMASAVEAAVRAVLGDEEAVKVYERIERAGDAHVPTAERALMWVSANMPKVADRVLTMARVNYGAAAA